MIETSFSLYKLIILYMLEKVDFPLTNAQITDIILGREYTSYFHLQQVLSDMVDTGLLETETHDHSTHYRATPDGRETLSLFGKEISAQIRSDIDAYLAEHSFRLRSESSVTADISRAPSGEYAVRGRITEGDSVLIDLTLEVPTEVAAHVVAENWRAKSSALYASVMKELTS